MDYKIEKWTISDLIDAYKTNNLNLNPPYQRNDIWSIANKKRLIKTIKDGFPLPAFFLHEKEGNSYDMVDGQQRTRTIIGYINDFFPDQNKVRFEESDKNYFLHNYTLPIITISNVKNEEDIEDFYYRVNKFGAKLNRPEILKAQYYNTPQQNLVEEIADNQYFQELGLFTESSKNRMNDYDFIGELLGLLKFGITDKKKSADDFYESQEITEEEKHKLKDEFFNLISPVFGFNDIYPLSKTRYRQRNDFYSLFSFLRKHSNLTQPTLEEFYKILIKIEKDISPSNEDCFAFQEYADNCVNQSNSKRAREERLQFFEDILLNKDDQPIKKNEDDINNERLVDVMEYYEMSNNDLINVSGFFTLDSKKLPNV